MISSVWRTAGARVSSRKELRAATTSSIVYCSVRTQMTIILIIWDVCLRHIDQTIFTKCFCGHRRHRCRHFTNVSRHCWLRYCMRHSHEKKKIAIADVQIRALWLDIRVHWHSSLHRACLLFAYALFKTQTNKSDGGERAMSVCGRTKEKKSKKKKTSQTILSIEASPQYYTFVWVFVRVLPMFNALILLYANSSFQFSLLNICDLFMFFLTEGINRRIIFIQTCVRRRRERGKERVENCISFN